MAIPRRVPTQATNLAQQLINIGMSGDELLREWSARGSSITQSELTNYGLGNITPQDFADVVRMFAEFRTFLAAGRLDVLYRVITE